MSAPECERERIVRRWKMVGRELTYIGVCRAPKPRPEGAGEPAPTGEGSQ